MFLWFLSSFILSITLTIILANSPLTLGLWILIIALIISFNIGFNISSWFAFIIFLIYIGGILVIFAYFSALSPNQPLEIAKITAALAFSLIILSLFSITFLKIDPSFSRITLTSSIDLIFFPQNIPILLFLAAVLFFILVAVVKIASINTGALRHFSFS